MVIPLYRKTWCMAVDKLSELADQVKAGATTGRVAMERG